MVTDMGAKNFSHTHRSTMCGLKKLASHFSDIFIEILIFSFTKMCLKMSSAKWRPFCLGLNDLIICFIVGPYTLPEWSGPVLICFQWKSIHYQDDIVKFTLFVVQNNFNASHKYSEVVMHGDVGCDTKVLLHPLSHNPKAVINWLLRI